MGSWTWQRHSCNDCGELIHDEETFIITKDYESFGVKGFIYVTICKECYREYQLKELGINV